MSDLRREVIAHLTGAGLAPLHRLGQNFMIDPGAVAALMAQLDCVPGMRVVEIGPGTGVLTAELLAAGCTVLAVELDRGLHALLNGRFATQIVAGSLMLVHGDCLESKNALHPAIVAFASEPWRLGANLPYDVALPVLLNAAALLGPARQPERMVATVQWEAAERLCSHPGEDAWGASAAVLQAAGVPTIIRRLAPSSFHPQPRVGSAILAWRPNQPMPHGFGQWCRAVFSSRRKVLTGALRDRGVTRNDAEAACQACHLDPRARLETLSASELLALYGVVSAMQSRSPSPESSHG